MDRNKLEIRETGAQGLWREVECGSNACEQMGGIDFSPSRSHRSKISTGRKTKQKKTLWRSLIGWG